MTGTETETTPYFAPIDNSVRMLSAGRLTKSTNYNNNKGKRKKISKDEKLKCFLQRQPNKQQYAYQCNATDKAMKEK